MLFQLTMFPSARKGASVSEDVAKVINIIDKSGLPYKVGPMSTTIEGEWQPVRVGKRWGCQARIESRRFFFF